MMKKVFEWLYHENGEQHWHVCTRLMTEDEAKRWFEAEMILRNEDYKFYYQKKSEIGIMVPLDEKELAKSMQLCSESEVCMAHEYTNNRS